jgi:hypothetical protein
MGATNRLTVDRGGGTDASHVASSDQKGPFFFQELPGRILLHHASILTVNHQTPNNDNATRHQQYTATVAMVLVADTRGSITTIEDEV